MVGTARRNLWRTAARLVPVVGVALATAVLPRPAAAQFSWFDRSGISAQDAYETIAEHGFRLVAPMMQNRDVYIADVVDRRQHRQRLIISRDNGQIVQRYFVDMGRPPAAALPGTPYGGQLPPRQAESGVFDRIVRGFNDDASPRPPAGIGDPDQPDAVAPQVLPKAQRLTRPRPADIEPRLATRRDDAPISSRPLTPEPTPNTAPPAAAPAKPQLPSAAIPADKPATPADKTASPPAAAPVQAVTPQPGAPASSPARATVVTSDPLRIPGTKDAEAARTAAAASKPVAAAKPAPAKTQDVPVAPLD